MSIRPGQAKGAYVGVDGSGSAAGDHKVLVDSSDTTANYLSSKISVSGGLTETITNPGGNEVLNISGSGIAGNRQSVFIPPQNWCSASGSPSFSKGSPGGPFIQSGGTFPKPVDVWQLPDNTSIASSFAPDSRMDFTQNIYATIYFLPNSGVVSNYDFQLLIYVLGDQQTQAGNPQPGYTKIIHPNTSANGGFSFNITLPATVIVPLIQGGSPASNNANYWWLELLKYHESGDTADAVEFLGLMLEYGVS